MLGKTVLVLDIGFFLSLALSLVSSTPPLLFPPSFSCQMTQNLFLCFILIRLEREEGSLWSPRLFRCLFLSTLYSPFFFFFSLRSCDHVIPGFTLPRFQTMSSLRRFAVINKQLLSYVPLGSFFFLGSAMQQKTFFSSLCFCGNRKIYPSTKRPVIRLAFCEKVLVDFFLC